MPREFLFELGKDPEKAPEIVWMVRPCEMYQEEVEECESYKGRFHQNFVAGQHADCSQWRKDFDNCMEWRKTQNLQALDEIVASEQRRIQERMDKTYANDVMSRRTTPPADFNAPLPPALEAKRRASYLFKYRSSTEPVEEGRGAVDSVLIWLKSWKVNKGTPTTGAEGDLLRSMGMANEPSDNVKNTRTV